jgi:hypothetical protein
MTATDRTAAQAYAGYRADIARLLDVLDMELAKHAEVASATPADWGRPGDLAKVRSDLIDTVAFLSGMDRALVEGFLADGEAAR